MSLEPSILALIARLQTAKVKAQFDKTAAWESVQKIICSYVELRGRSTSESGNIFDVLELALLTKDEPFSETLRQVLVALGDEENATRVMAMIWRERGNGFYREEDFENAIPCYKKAIEIYPSFATALNELALSLQAIDQVEEAIANYKRAIKIKTKQGGDSSYIWNNLGLLYQELDRYSEAIDSFEKAIHSCPDFAEYRYNLTLSFFSGFYKSGQKNVLEKSEIQIKRAISCDSQKADYHALHGMILLLLFRLHENEDSLSREEILNSSVRAYRDAIELNSSEYSYYFSDFLDCGLYFALFHKYEVEDNTKCLEECIDIGRKAQDLVKQQENHEVSQKIKMQVDKLEFKASLKQGYDWFMQCKYEEAEDQFRKALSLNPEHEDSRFYLAATLIKQGDDLLTQTKGKEAEQKYREAFTLNPKDETNLRHAASVVIQAFTLLKKGQRNESIAKFRQAVKLHQEAGRKGSIKAIEKICFDHNLTL